MRPDTVFDPMLQHERTALAWERTAIASMVSGTLLARRAADLHVSLAALGLLQVVLGAALLIWDGTALRAVTRAPFAAARARAHPDAVRIIGLTTVGFCGAATVIAIASAMT